MTASIEGLATRAPAGHVALGDTSRLARRFEFRLTCAPRAARIAFVIPTFAGIRRSRCLWRRDSGKDEAITNDNTNPDVCYLDLHVHSADGSDDAGGTVEGYLKWIEGRRRNGYRIDGFVLTEHRRFDSDLDYSALAEQYGVTILRGVEVETDVGHVLVYGAGPEFFERFDLADVSLPYEDVFRVAWESGGIAVGAHAGRPRIGLVEHVDERDVSLDHVRVIEALNGGSSDYENGVAHDLAEARGLRMIGASDTHFVSALGRCMTQFNRPIRTVDDLVQELREGEFRPVRVEDTLPGATPSERPSAAKVVATTSGQGELAGEALTYDESVIGEEVHVGSLEITPDSIARYCEALQEQNPLYVDEAWATEHGPYGGVIAPPGILMTSAFQGGPDPRVQFGNNSFMAGTRLESFEPIRAGDSIDAHVQVKEVYEKTGRSGRMVFVVRRTRYSNQHGVDVAATESSVVYRQTQALKDESKDGSRDGSKDGASA